MSWTHSGTNAGEQATNGLMTYADLEARGKPPGETDKAKRKWLHRHMAAWGLRPLMGGRGDGARFRPADVDRAEERAAQIKGPRRRRRAAA